MYANELREKKKKKTKTPGGMGGPQHKRPAISSSSSKRYRRQTLFLSPIFFFSYSLGRLLLSTWEIDLRNFSNRTERMLLRNLCMLNHHVRRHHQPRVGEREKRIYGPIMRDTCSLLYVISLLVVVYRNHDIISRRASYLSRTPILHKSSSEEVNEWRLKRVAVWMKPDGSPLGVIETVFTNKQQIVQMTISTSTECYLSNENCSLAVYRGRISYTSFVTSLRDKKKKKREEKIQVWGVPKSLNGGRSTPRGS